MDIAQLVRDQHIYFRLNWMGGPHCHLDMKPKRKECYDPITANCARKVSLWRSR